LRKYVDFSIHHPELEIPKDKAVDSLRLAILLTGVIPTGDADALADYVDQLLGPASGARMRDTLNLIVRSQLISGNGGHDNHGRGEKVVPGLPATAPPRAEKKD
jgi:hypothetical protein